MSAHDTTLLIDDKLQIEKYWKIIKPRLHLVIIIAVLAVAAAFIKVSTQTPIYSASGLLMIEPEYKNIIMFDNNAAFAGYRNEYFNTQIEILQSRSLANMVWTEFNSTIAPSLGIRKEKNFHARGPQITPLEFTQLVQVSYQSTHPRAAAELVNMLFEKFIEFNLDIKTQSSRQAAEYIAKQIKNLQQGLSQKEGEMQEYGKRKELFFISREDSTIVEKFSDLNKAYTDAQIDRINKESVYTELSRTSYDSFPQVKNDQLISNLKSNFSNLESEFQRKSQIFKSSYPEMQKLKSQMDSLQAQITKEIKDLAEKILREVRGEFQSARNKEEGLAKLLEEQKGVMVSSNADAIYYKTLGIEVNNMRNLLDYLVKKQKESLLSSRLEGIQTSNIKIIDRAEVPQGPINMGKRKLMVMALILGLTFGFGLIFLVDYLDQTFKSTEDVKTTLGIPALGTIPSANAKATPGYYSRYYGDGPKKPGHRQAGKGQKQREIEFINFIDPESLIAEHYRSIRTSILLSVPKSPPKIISITSALPSEGKTATTINLAISFSQLRKRVLIIDCDMRKPRIHKIFKIDNSVGLSSFLVGRAKLQDILHKTHIPNLYLVPSGPLPPNPTELIDADVMHELLQKLLEKVDFIFIDTPPLVGIVDPILLGKQSDGTLLVTWAGKTHRSVVKKAKEELDKFDIRTLGVILNRTDSRRGEYGYNYSHYNYYSYRYKEENGPEAESLPKKNPA